jgi:hypothetical protein
VIRGFGLAGALDARDRHQRSFSAPAICAPRLGRETIAVGDQSAPDAPGSGPSLPNRSLPAITAGWKTR